VQPKHYLKKGKIKLLFQIRRKTTFNIHISWIKWNCHRNCAYIIHCIKWMRLFWQTVARMKIRRKRNLRILYNVSEQRVDMCWITDKHYKIKNRRHVKSKLTKSVKNSLLHTPFWFLFLAYTQLIPRSSMVGDVIKKISIVINVSVNVFPCNKLTCIQLIEPNTIWNVMISNK